MSSQHNPDRDLLLPFGEAVIVVNRSRQLVYAQGALDVIFAANAPDKFIGQPWLDLLQAHGIDCIGLHWAVEALFEGYIAQRYLPSEFPFKPGYIARPALLSEQEAAIRILATPKEKLDDFLTRNLRSSLNSITGFTDVILKGIDGPLTDLQLEDLGVVMKEGHFALQFMDDMRVRFILPALAALVPVRAGDLFQFTPDDLSQKKLARQRLQVAISIAQEEVLLYSNGAIRLLIADLLRTMVQVAAPQSQITIETQQDQDVMEVWLSYRQAERMTTGRIEPLDLFEAPRAQRSDKFLMVVSSAHARLSAYGCAAWGIVEPNRASIVMTVPIWHGPGT